MVIRNSRLKALLQIYALVGASISSVHKEHREPLSFLFGMAKDKCLFLVGKLLYELGHMLQYNTQQTNEMRFISVELDSNNR
jgi:hypothetical protein